MIVNVPLDMPLGGASVTLTLAVSFEEVSVIELGTTLQVDPAGPPLQVSAMAPWKPVVDDAISVNDPL